MPEQRQQAAGLVRDLDRQHVGHVDLVPGGLQQFAGGLPLGDDQAQHADLLRVGQGERDDIDAGIGQQLAGSESTRRVYSRQQVKAGVVSWQNSGTSKVKAVNTGSILP